jgi:phenylalanyl-tRNA synthetase beta chain
MKVSYSWIKEYINVNLSPKDCAKVLTDTGLEVEGICEFESVKGGLKGLIVGEVLTCEAHPNADRLNKTSVDIGSEVLDIVCGAPNVDVGLKVVIAPVGTVLWDSEGNSFKIKKGKIRGEISKGMICGADEIGMGDASHSIMVLDTKAEVGTRVSSHFRLESDTIFDIGLTPNRSDAMGHMGVALDLRAGLAAQGRKLVLNSPSVDAFNIDRIEKSIKVVVEDYDACPRYAGICISGLIVKESPEWIRRRLLSIGLTPQNNLVDITNYVMHETGNPLHAFDADKIKGNKIFVKKLSKETKFTTLDKVERNLHPDDLMICNEESAMCLAGVYGGLDSGVTEKTSSIFLEGAFFNPVSIRKSARRHGLNTDASFRFERSVNPDTILWSLKRAALMIQEFAGGYLSSEMIDIYPKPILPTEVEFSFKKCDELIGEELDRDSIKEILHHLEIIIVEERADLLKLSVPPYRTDVQREVDVIEEVLRIYGYNNISMSGRINASLSILPKPDIHKVQEKVSNLLSDNGFYEAMSNSLTKGSHIEGFQAFNADSQVVLLNPLSQDLNALRQSLLFGGLESIAFNLNRKTADIFLYEFGKIYNCYGDEFVEERQLALWMTGNKQEENWNVGAQKVDFFYMKGIVQKLLQKLGLQHGMTISISKSKLFQDGVIYKSRNQKIAEIGLLRNSLLRKNGIKQEVFYAELNWDIIIQMYKDQKIKHKAVSKFPSVRRDLALLMGKEVSFSEIKNIAFRTEKHLLKEVKLFDVYEGAKLLDGKKSYALSFTFRDEDKTLVDKVVDTSILKIFKSLEQQLNVELRDGVL